MQTAEKKTNGAQGATARNNSPRTANRPSLTGEEAKNESTQDQVPAKVEEAKATEIAEAKTGDSPAMDHPTADVAAAEVKGEPTAEEKPALSLDAKIKAVNELHRKTIQRLALIARLKTLEEFEVALLENNDELESNPYQGCKLIIEDDKRRQFVTNTPNLIRMVSQFIFDACETKLAEIEATINFPQA